LRGGFVEPMDPVGPYGAKASSETPNLMAAPAIANAVFDAVGVRIRDLPITPEKVLAGLKAARQHESIKKEQEATDHASPPLPGADVGRRSQPHVGRARGRRAASLRWRDGLDSHDAPTHVEPLSS